jgi:hypothetical protein
MGPLIVTILDVVKDASSKTSHYSGQSAQIHWTLVRACLLLPRTRCLGLCGKESHCLLRIMPGRVPIHDVRGSFETSATSYFDRRDE